MLKRIVIENFRSCLRTRVDLHPRLSVLIGPNGSGKTNILQGILFLYKLASEAPYRIRDRESSSVSSRLKATFEMRQVRAQVNATVDARTNSSNEDVMLSSKQKWKLSKKRKDENILDLPLALFAGNQMWSPHRYYAHSRSLTRRQVRIIQRDILGKGIDPWVDAALTKIAAYCRGITYYGASQFTNPSACPASFQIEAEDGRERSRSFNRGGHVKVLYNMYSAKKAESERYERFMRIVGPRGLRLIDDLKFREVETSAVDYSVRVGGKVEIRRRNKLLVIPQFRIGKQKLSPNQLSEGTFKTLALLFHVLTAEGTLLLIEEPEVCVHHGLLSSILELIKSSSKRKQIIISTHSNFVLDHVKPENVYRVTFDKALGTVATHIPKTMTSLEFAALRNYLEREGNLGEFWREGGLGDRQ